MSTRRQCLQDLEPSAATRLVQPGQAQELDPSVYCSVRYSRSGLESERKVHTCRMGLLMVSGWFVREVPRQHWSAVSWPSESHTVSTRHREPGQVGQTGITEG
jgi:hypothetical protein